MRQELQLLKYGKQSNSLTFFSLRSLNENHADSALLHVLISKGGERRWCRCCKVTVAPPVDVRCDENVAWRRERTVAQRKDPYQTKRTTAYPLFLLQQLFCAKALNEIRLLTRPSAKTDSCEG